MVDVWWCCFLVVAAAGTGTSTRLVGKSMMLLAGEDLAGLRALSFLPVVVCVWVNSKCEAKVVKIEEREQTKVQV